MSQPPISLTSRLVAGTRFQTTRDGVVLRTADGAHHALALAPADAVDLLDALAAERPPTSPIAAAALDALVTAGHAVPASTAAPRVRVDGAGPLARAVAGALARMGAVVADHRHGPADPADPAGPADPAVRVLDVEPASDTDALVTCWREDARVLVAPAAVRATHVVARREAARRHHRDTPDERTVPLPGGRVVASSRPEISPVAGEVAAAHVAAEVLRRATSAAAAPTAPTREDHLLTLIDLRTLLVTRHPVLPVPAPPR